MSAEALILFAGGADGWGVGLKRAGIQPIALAESEPERRAALRHHHPEAVIYEDVRHVTRERLLADLGRLPSVVVGSPPCQDISSANNGRARGVDGERSSLYFDFIRIVGEVRPDWYAAENSPAVKTRGYDRLHAALDAVDYTCWPSVVGAREVGYFHLRKRSWLAGVDVSDASREPLGGAGQPWTGAPRDAADAGRDLELQQEDGARELAIRRRAGHGGIERPDADADEGRGGPGRVVWARQPDAGEVGEGCSLPLGLAAIERAAQTLGLGGRSRLAEHYRMADGVRSGLARLCVSAYGDALVPDIAEAFARVMPQLVTELREGNL